MPTEAACDQRWLRVEQSTLTVWQKSAEGILGDGKRARNPREDSPTEGLNGTLWFKWQDE